MTYYHDYHPPRLARYFHRYPHLDRSFRLTSNTFNLRSSVYRTAIILAVIIHVLWLILLLFALLWYLYNRLYTCRKKQPIRLRRWLRLMRLLILICLALAVANLIYEILFHIMIVWKINLKPDKFSVASRLEQAKEDTRQLLLKKYNEYFLIEQRKMEGAMPMYQILEVPTLDNYINGITRYRARHHFEIDLLRRLAHRKMSFVPMKPVELKKSDQPNPLIPLFAIERRRFTIFIILWVFSILIILFLKRFVCNTRILWLAALLSILFFCGVTGAVCAEGMVFGDICSNVQALKDYLFGVPELYPAPNCVEYLKEMYIHQEALFAKWKANFEEAIQNNNRDIGMYANTFAERGFDGTSNKTLLSKKQFFEHRNVENFTKYCPHQPKIDMMDYDINGGLHSFCTGDVCLRFVFAKLINVLLIITLLTIIVCIFIYTRPCILVVQQPCKFDDYKRRRFICTTVAIWKWITLKCIPCIKKLVRRKRCPRTCNRIAEGNLLGCVEEAPKEECDNYGPCNEAKIDPYGNPYCILPRKTPSICGSRANMASNKPNSKTLCGPQPLPKCPGMRKKYKYSLPYDEMMRRKKYCEIEPECIKETSGPICCESDPYYMPDQPPSLPPLTVNAPTKRNPCQKSSIISDFKNAAAQKYCKDTDRQKLRSGPEECTAPSRPKSASLCGDRANLASNKPDCKTLCGPQPVAKCPGKRKTNKYSTNYDEENRRKKYCEPKPECVQEKSGPTCSESDPYYMPDQPPPRPPLTVNQPCVAPVSSQTHFTHTPKLHKSRAESLPVYKQRITVPSAFVSPAHRPTDQRDVAHNKLRDKSPSREEPSTSHPLRSPSSERVDYIRLVHSRPGSKIRFASEALPISPEVARKLNPLNAEQRDKIAARVSSPKRYVPIEKKPFKHQDVRPPPSPRSRDRSGHSTDRAFGQTHHVTYLPTISGHPYGKRQSSKKYTFKPLEPLMSSGQSSRAQELFTNMSTDQSTVAQSSKTKLKVVKCTKKDNLSKRHKRGKTTRLRANNNSLRNKSPASPISPPTSLNVPDVNAEMTTGCDKNKTDSIRLAPIMSKVLKPRQKSSATETRANEDQPETSSAKPEVSKTTDTDDPEKSLNK